MVREPLSQKEFENIYSKVPRLTVEVIVKSNDGILLTKRQIEPCRGMWHIPGGTVRFGELITDAVHRKAIDELREDVIIDSFLGYIEYPSHFNNGLDSPVGLAFITHLKEPQKLPLDSYTKWFKSIPSNMHEEQKAFLGSHSLLPQD